MFCKALKALATYKGVLDRHINMLVDFILISCLQLKDVLYFGKFGCSISDIDKKNKEQPSVQLKI